MPKLALVNGRKQQPAVQDNVEDTRDSKLRTMKERFPQRSDQELLKVTMLSSLIYFDDYFIGRFSKLLASLQGTVLW